MSTASYFQRQAARPGRWLGRFQPGRGENLSPGLARKIREHGWSSEILMRIVQLGILAAFGALYAFSPKTSAATNSLVPVALTVYFALSVVGLVWSVRRRIPDWAAYMSIVFDIGLLMVLIWSFHQQYGQPASFYLKSPTFLYVFIFIALRALRFEPKFVIAAGLLTVAAWASMVVYVVVSDPGGTAITRDYVAYLTSNALLVGAEVDKLITVGVVTGILYLVLRRARALLFEAVSQQSAAANLSRFFDEAIASRIRGADDLLSQGTRRQAAVLLVDLRDFTKLAARIDPTEVIQILAAYQRRVVPLIRQHGGIIDKFMGDGILATFGAIEGREAYAADALRAIDAIVADAALWPQSSDRLSRLPPRSVGMAVAAGPIVSGVVGANDRLEFTAIGAPVNLAAKLEDLNKPLATQALVAADAYALALEQGYRPGQPATLLRLEQDAAPGLHELAVLHP